MTIVALLAVALMVQGPKLVPNRVECSRCTIRLSLVATMGGNNDDLVEWPQHISEDRQGRYYVTQPNKRELPALFDATGRRLRAFGAPGEGPGEFKLAAIVAVDPRTDTVFVTDWGTSRLSVFSPQLKFVRSFPFPANARGLGVLSNHTLIAMARMSNRASVELPFHIFQRDGQRAKTIGDRGRPYTREREMFFTHRLAVSRRGGFWAVPLWGEYRIEHWTENGARDAYLLRRPDWHTVLESSTGDAGNPEVMEYPPSSNEGVAETETGLLWLVTRVADPKRKHVVLDTLQNLESKYVVARDPDRVWDSVIELIDPVRGVVLAAQRFDELFNHVLPSGKVVRTIEDDAGVRVRVFKLSVSREH